MNAPIPNSQFPILFQIPIPKFPNSDFSTLCRKFGNLGEFGKFGRFGGFLDFGLLGIRNLWISIFDFRLSEFGGWGRSEVGVLNGDQIHSPAVESHKSTASSK